MQAVWSQLLEVKVDKRPAAPDVTVETSTADGNDDSSCRIPPSGSMHSEAQSSPEFWTCQPFLDATASLQPSACHKIVLSSLLLSIIVVGGRVFDIAGGPPNM